MSSAAQSLAHLMLIAAAGLGSVAAFGVANREQPGARGFSLALVSAAVWSLVIAVNIWPRQFLPLHVSMTLRNGLILGIVVGWLLFVIEYTRRERVSFRPLPVAVVLVIPILTIVITATNPFHHLAIGPGTPPDVGGGPQIDWGPWYLVFLTYAFLVSLLAAGLLVRDLRSAHGPYRRQLQLLLAGFAIGFLGVNDFILTGAIEGIPSYIRTSPFLFLATAGLWSIALFRHQLFGLVPISRRTVVETVPDPIIVVDESETIVDINPAAARTFGTSEAAVGGPLADFWRDQPALHAAYQDTPNATEIEIDHQGTTRHFLMTVEHIDTGQAAALIILRDVTTLKQREYQLERKNEQLERLAGIISHDLQTPLSTAEKITRLLRADVDTSEPGVEQSLSDLETTHRRLREFSDNLPRLARESTDVEQPIDCDLAELAASAWNVVDTGSLELCIETELTVTGDPRRLQQVFENLFQNVAKHGRVQVEDPALEMTDQSSTGSDHSPPERERQIATTVHVGSYADGFFVEDDGPGIPSTQSSELFAYGMGTGDGRGFGLAIVRTIIEAHGWEIEVTESSSGGARFEIDQN